MLSKTVILFVGKFFIALKIFQRKKSEFLFLCLVVMVVILVDAEDQYYHIIRDAPKAQSTPFQQLLVNENGHFVVPGIKHFSFKILNDQLHCSFLFTFML